MTNIYESTYPYGPTCFQSDGVRSIDVTIDDKYHWTVHYKTVVVQGMTEGIAKNLHHAIEQADLSLVDVFKQYKKKFGADDKLLFKSYFETDKQ